MPVRHFEGQALRRNAFFANQAAAVAALPIRMAARSFWSRGRRAAPWPSAHDLAVDFIGAVEAAKRDVPLFNTGAGWTLGAQLGRPEGTQCGQQQQFLGKWSPNSSGGVKC